MTNDSAQLGRLRHVSLPDFLHIPDIENAERFMEFLEHLRRNVSETTWRHTISKDTHIAAWRHFLSSDPYTRWGLIKPNGYAGDPSLMDFAYGHKSIARHIEHAGELGRRIYEITFRSKLSNSARERVRFISSVMDEMASARDGLRIGAFACGHARELEQITHASARKIACFYAIDSDHKSLSEINHCVSSKLNIESVCRNLFRLPGSLLESMNLDLSYSLGLFDYLQARPAKRVLEIMWKATAPGGTLLVGNLTEDTPNIGYCEAIMDWWMVLRTEDQMNELAEHLVELGEASTCTLHRLGSYYFLEASKISNDAA